MISKRKGYKVRDGSFIHNMGCDVPNMWLKNTDNLFGTPAEGPTELDENGDLIPICPMTMDEAEHQTAQNIACRFVRLFISFNINVHDDVFNWIFISALPISKLEKTACRCKRYTIH